MNFTRRSRSYPPTPHCPKNSTVYRRRKSTFWKYFCENKYNTSSVCSVGKPDQASARKLAAGLWRLRLAPAGHGRCVKCPNLKCRSSCNVPEPCVGPLNSKFPSHPLAREYGTAKKHLVRTSEFSSSLKPRFHQQIRSCSPYSKHTMEGATKWDPTCSSLSNEVSNYNNCMKFPEDQVTSVSVATSVQGERAQAQFYIHELQVKQRSLKKHIKHLLGKLGEERSVWQRRELQKIRVVMDDLKKELVRERKSRESMEILNCKLISELAEAKLSAEKFRKDYEGEKKGRELIEEVCNQLANKIAEDKAKVEAMTMETIKMQEEVEEERKMLQLAEGWREGRVQMKLIDAKLALEDKYHQMNKLIGDLETFLVSGSAVMDVMELRKADSIKQAAKSVSIKDLAEFCYVPPPSGQIYSILEELWKIEKSTEPYSKKTPASDISKIQNGGSSMANQYSRLHSMNHSNGRSGNSSPIDEDGRDWESESCARDQGSIYSHEENVNRIERGKSKTAQQSREVSRTTRDQEDSPTTQVSEVCSTSAEQSLQKTSKLQGSFSSNEKCNKLTLDNAGGEITSNGKISVKGTTSRKRVPGKGSNRSMNPVKKWNSQDLNPHVTREMKGFTEWPQLSQKNSLNAKLLEARMESQRAQLRSVLKRKSK